MFSSTFSRILPSSFFTYFTLKAFFKFLMMLFGWFIFSKEGLGSFGDLIRFKGNRSVFLLWLLSGKQGVEEQSCPHACWKPQFSKDVSFNCFRESSGIFPAGLLQLLTQLSGTFTFGELIHPVPLHLPSFPPTHPVLSTCVCQALPQRLGMQQRTRVLLLWSWHSSDLLRFSSVIF